MPNVPLNEKSKWPQNIRLSNYDYHNGWFFITSKTDFNKPLFTGKTFDLVRNELISIPKKFEGVDLDALTLVPSHVHCILIFDDAPFSLPEVWRRFKAVTTKLVHDSGLVSGALWQRNYFEHIIRNERALALIREYIKNNPLKEGLPWDEIYESPKEWRL